MSPRLPVRFSKLYVSEENLSCPQIVHYDAGVATANSLDSELAGQSPSLFNLLRLSMCSVSHQMQMHLLCRCSFAILCCLFIESSTRDRPDSDTGFDMWMLTYL